MGAAKRTDLSNIVPTRLRRLHGRTHRNRGAGAARPTAWTRGAPARHMAVDIHRVSSSASSAAVSTSVLARHGTEPTSKHIQALLQGLVAVELARQSQQSPQAYTASSSSSPSSASSSPPPSRLVASTRALLARLRRHRATRTHDPTACPGCRGIRRVVATSSLHLAAALRRGDAHTAGVFRRVVGQLEDAWAGDIGTPRHTDEEEGAPAEGSSASVVVAAAAAEETAAIAA